MTEELSAPSKINWFLAVGGVRPSDSRHELLSCFQILREPCDKLVVDWDAPAGVTVECDLPGVPSGADNLVGKAALLFAQKTKIKPSWSIKIEKHIPVAAGMGGGSSDAGTILRALNLRYQALSPAELNALALNIGADVPLFVEQKDSIGRGAGELLSPIVPELGFPPVLVVFPGFPVSARWAYQHFAEDASSYARAPQELENFLKALSQQDHEAACRSIRNDLGTALFQKFPVLTMLREKLESLGALRVEVSGSGPSLFAVFSDRKTRSAAAAEIASFTAGVSGMRIIETESL